MRDDFILVHRSALPECYELVLKAKDLVEGEGKPISKVCRELNISRSTYYKYKDLIFYPSNNNMKKAIYAFKVSDTQGVLSRIISCITEAYCNVLSINQNMPLHNLAYITIMIDVTNQNIPEEKLLAKLRMLPYVKSVEVLAYE